MLGGQRNHGWHGLVWAITIFAGMLPARGASPLDAMRLSQISGRPLLALASSPNCIPCQRLKGLIAHDASVLRAVRPYVFVEMDHSSREFTQFRQQYPVEVPGVPMLYVVRADGTLMYGRFGGMSSNELTQLLDDNATKAGRPITPQEREQFEVSLVSARRHFAAGEVYPALQLVETAARVPSHALAVRESKTTQQQIVKALETWLTKLDRQLARGEQVHTAAYQLAYMYVRTKSQPAIRERAGKLLARYEAAPTTRLAVMQGKELVRARLLDQRNDGKRARASYERIVRLDKSSPTGRHAAKKLQQASRPGTENISSR